MFFHVEALIGHFHGQLCGGKNLSHRSSPMDICAKAKTDLLTLEEVKQ